MPTLTSSMNKKVMRRHLLILREYARLVVLREETLPLRKEAARSKRMKEFLDIGKTFQLTEKELVCLLYRDLLVVN